MNTSRKLVELGMPPQLAKVIEVAIGSGGGGGDVPASRTIATQWSLTGGGNLSTNRTLNLTNDTETPGPNMVYGTDGSGVRGWKSDPGGGGGGDVPSTRTISTQHSLTGGGDLSSNRTLALVNDTASPGNSKYYGTDGSGDRGWFDLPGGGSGAVDSVNGQTGTVVLDLEDLGATAFGASIAEAEDADEVKTLLGIDEIDMDTDQFLVGTGLGSPPEAQTPAEVADLLKVNSVEVCFAVDGAAEVEDGTYVMSLDFPFSGTISRHSTVCTANEGGAAKITWTRNGTNITGLSSLTPKTSRVILTPSQAISAGDILRLVVSDVAAPGDLTGLVANLRVRRN